MNLIQTKRANKMLKPKSNASSRGDAQTVVFPTTEGRRRFPDFIQDSYGTKTITGFDRYGRFLGAIVPPEAVFLLADEGAEIDEFAKQRIRECARQLIRELEARNQDLGDTNTVEELRSERSQRSAPN